MSHDEAGESSGGCAHTEEEFGLSSKSCWGYHAKIGLVGKSEGLIKIMAAEQKHKVDPFDKMERDKTDRISDWLDVKVKERKN